VGGEETLEIDDYCQSVVCLKRLGGTKHGLQGFTPCQVWWELAPAFFYSYNCLERRLIGLKETIAAPHVTTYKRVSETGQQIGVLSCGSAPQFLDENEMSSIMNRRTL